MSKLFVIGSVVSFSLAIFTVLGHGDFVKGLWCLCCAIYCQVNSVRLNQK